MTHPAARIITGIFVVGSLPTFAFGAPLALSETPLTVSSAVQPNVMLLIDNSGSMDNIIWASGYDSTVTYPEWQYRNSSGNWVTMDSSDGNLHFSSLKEGDCSTGYKRFRKETGTSTVKCLKLPDPVGSGNTRYAPNYLNYLLETYPGGTDLTDGTIPKQYRMEVAREVASNLVANTSGMRFGVSRFYGPSSDNYGHGAKIDAICGSSVSTIQSAIAGYESETNTPLAEGLYEITRYFRGMSSKYHSDTTYTSPIQYRCQKNFTVVVTDGLPTYDTNIATDDTDDTADADRGLPNWDGQNPTTTQDMYPNFPRYSDGFKPSDGSAGEGASLYLDDIAKFAWDIDLKKSGTDSSGVSYQDAKFPTQNMHTYTVGFSTSNQMLQDAAEYGHGEYYTASNATQLSAALRSAMADILAKSGSSSAAAANAGFIGTDTKVYQARFNSADWSGQLLAFSVEDDSASANYGSLITTGSGPGGSLWDAGAELPAWSSRNIFTVKNGAGIPFRWDQLSTSAEPSTEGDQQGLLGSEAVLEYLRGDDSGEVQSGGAFRDRTSKLGDIVNSAPVFVGAPNFRYPDGLESIAYSTFVTTNKNRAKMIYVGANDGMLHGFDAETGVEEMAFVPGALYGKLAALKSRDYSHRYYVDGSPTVGDAFVGSAWRTMLVSGLNRGGQSIFALDVTDPTAFSENATNAAKLVRWEFSDRNDADLGYTYSRPAIVRLHNGRWAAIFGNGYNNTEADGRASATGNAVLFIVDLADGTLIKKLDTGVGTAQDPKRESRPNGLATPAPVDLDGDRIVDAVYAGDFFGNLWKFDLADDDPTKWEVAFNAKPLYKACAAASCTEGASSNRQPITVRPEVGKHPKGAGVLVYFGTGKYLETGDNNGAAGGRQTFYAIWDNGALVGSRDNLVQQRIIHEGSYRITEKNTIDWTTKKGWFVDLVPPSGTGEGERQVTDPLLRNNRIIFTTVIPNNDPCVPGGPSWLMELDARTGSRLTYSPFDVNADGKFSTADFLPVTENDVSGSAPPSGVKTEGGAAARPSVMAGEGQQERKYVSTSEGLQTVVENPGPWDTGRQAWRQLSR